ncbi:VanZ like family protein [Bhargavaea beijingensis]|uniref:VanZ like family protein n=1 Tax=Bhargavaea beijingensis TaxID=426756 RepID=A0A1G6ZB60_9BACL|nr:VanZ family protein [Bhargavaea beijingensis]SDD99984.1 VanZ like family protein [Bhargavaea beijingensis]
MNDERSNVLTVSTIFTLLWAALIVIATCTSDPRAFLYEREVSFHLESEPNLYDLLILSDIHFESDFYLLQKIGHFLSFGVLYGLLVTWIKRPGLVFVLCGIFALFTEVLQLFFGRSGRLFDVGIDLMGVILAYQLCKYVNRQRT